MLDPPTATVPLQASSTSLEDQGGSKKPAKKLVKKVVLIRRSPASSDTATSQSETPALLSEHSSRGQQQQQQQPALPDLAAAGRGSEGSRHSDTPAATHEHPRGAAGSAAADANAAAASSTRPAVRPQPHGAAGIIDGAKSASASAQSQAAAPSPPTRSGSAVGAPPGVANGSGSTPASEFSLLSRVQLEELAASLTSTVAAREQQLVRQAEQMALIQSQVRVVCVPSAAFAVLTGV